MVDTPGDSVKVSVLMVTYNHEDFIAQAIESVLMQQVDFQYEIVIGEDCSTDRTRDIVTAYARKYPDIIRPLFHRANLGMNRNFAAAFHACRGRYVAVLDGDDYWTSPLKLKRQVDMLDANPEFAMCFHPTLRVSDGQNHKPTKHPASVPKSVSTIEDVLVTHFIPLGSVVFRRGLFGKLPDWSLGLLGCDWLLHILNAQYGKIGYIDEVMGAYRLHSGGSFSTRPREWQLQDGITLLVTLQRHLDGKYSRHLRESIACHRHVLFLHHCDTAWWYERHGELVLAMHSAAKAILAYPLSSIVRPSDRAKLRTVLRAMCLARNERGIHGDLIRLLLRLYVRSSALSWSLLHQAVKHSLVMRHRESYEQEFLASAWT